MQEIGEKGGATFQGIKLLLCENPLPPIEEAVAAAREEVARSNYYTDPVLGPGFMRITTALPEDNRRFVTALKAVMAP
jgi:histidinol-phosphate aminotransferase